MTFGEQVTTILSSIIKDNLFFIVLLVTFTLFCVDYYHRFLRLNKDTDHINLLERYAWLEYYRNRRK